MDRGVARFQLGGHSYAVPVTMYTAIEIEDTLDAGVVELLQKIVSNVSSFRLGHAVEILRIALRNAQKLNEDELANAVVDAGAMATFDAAGQIIGQLFKTPTKGNRRAGKAKAPTARKKS